jgi:predicted nucleic acid-binding protein
MKRYLLDTGILVAYLQGKAQVVHVVTPLLTTQQAATSMVVYAEVVEHFKSFPDFATRKRHLQQLLRSISPYFLTYPILERYADICRSMRRPHGKGLIGDIDTLITATALERNLTVVTYDTDFQRVPGLKVTLLSRSE